MVPLSPVKLDEILQSNLWNDFIFRDAEIHWQASLLEPSGGMDNFVKAFARQPLTRQNGTLDGLVRFGAKVLAIGVADDRITTSYDDNGSRRLLSTDYCISTIPMPVFRELKTNLEDAYMKAARNLPIEACGKVGWQAERFWETRDQIYGGISWTTDTIRQVWYPSSGFLSAKGMLTGAYMYGKSADAFNARPVEERLAHRARAGRAAARRLLEVRRARDRDRLEQHGAFRFRLGGRDRSGLRRECRGAGDAAGPLPQAGDQITFWSGWQEGAIISAWEAVKSIDRQTNPTANRG